MKEAANKKYIKNSRLKLGLLFLFLIILFAVLTTFILNLSKNEPDVIKTSFNLFMKNINYSEDLNELNDADGDEQIPYNFKYEFFDPVKIQARDYQISENKKILSFSLNSSVKESSKQVSSLLTKNLWNKIKSENECATTFVKSSGVYTWCLVTFTQVSETTVVVITIN